jgi:hypothetical protein
VGDGSSAADATPEKKFLIILFWWPLSVSKRYIRLAYFIS